MHVAWIITGSRCVVANLKLWATDCEDTKVMAVRVKIRQGEIGIGEVDYRFSPKEAIEFANAIKQVAHTAMRERK